MQTTLFQKHIFKGTQKFEIIDDTVHVHLKAPFRQEESLTVMLTILNLSLIHISEPTRPTATSRMPSSA